MRAVINLALKFTTRSLVCAILCELKIVKDFKKIIKIFKISQESNLELSLPIHGWREQKVSWPVREFLRCIRHLFQLLCRKHRCFPRQFFVFHCFHLRAEKLFMSLQKLTAENCLKFWKTNFNQFPILFEFLISFRHR